MTIGIVVFMLGLAVMMACSGWEFLQPVVIASDAPIPKVVKNVKNVGLLISIVGLALVVYEIQTRSP
ncbi:hypothetical protein LMG22037_06377 [Paraburkholderia phenoliruptrix]|uniref:Uncharacterized protein n=1 Tax=Paraburkholderia phenoliruptrix TaxID=252970 RepID=A0A6J5CLR3_9BURK|nr:hypothetical protein [Paraburkholderia phenoliruptrix]CAB3740263.1 hypothetical protein LMG22037_06377 [Paraburkholderia phenoliruptrix]